MAQKPDRALVQLFALGFRNGLLRRSIPVFPEDHGVQRGVDGVFFQGSTAVLAIEHTEIKSYPELARHLKFFEEAGLYPTSTSLPARQACVVEVIVPISMFDSRIPTKKKREAGKAIMDWLTENIRDARIGRNEYSVPFESMQFSIEVSITPDPSFPSGWTFVRLAIGETRLADTVKKALDEKIPKLSGPISTGEINPVEPAHRVLLLEIADTRNPWEVEKVRRSIEPVSPDCKIEFWYAWTAALKAQRVPDDRILFQRYGDTAVAESFWVEAGQVTRRYPAADMA